MNESMTLVVSIVGTGIGITGVLGLMLRMLATNMARQTMDVSGPVNPVVEPAERHRGKLEDGCPRPPRS